MNEFVSAPGYAADGASSSTQFIIVQDCLLPMPLLLLLWVLYKLLPSP
uniref:Uncharacterized protein n=1 Tax=Picea sitchensis TaxID=3332 RepID=A0A6B9XSZ1_PICSI|nr:hypothetical protein Q903MT_gene4146 [Picea sitchensis]